MINISLTFDEEMKLYTLIKIELRHCIKEKRSYEKKLKKNEISEEWIKSTKHVMRYLDENIKVYKAIYNKLKGSD